MIVADVMVRRVLAVGPETPLLQAIRLMTEHKVSGLPVLGPEGQIVGMLTEGDLLRRVETDTAGEPAGWLVRLLMPGWEPAKYILTHGRRVGEIMTSDPVTVAESVSLSDAVALMQSRHVKRLPVVTGNRVVGVISRADIVRQVGAVLSAASACTGSDGEILRAIIATMDREAWAPKRLVSVAVEGGVVLLDGCVYNLAERDAMTVLAESVPGVKCVENRVVCVDPYSGMRICGPAEEQ